MSSTPTPSIRRRPQARSRRRSAVGVATTVALSLALVVPAQAVTPAARPDPDAAKSDIERDIETSQEHLVDLADEASAALSALNRTTTQLAATRSRLARQTQAVQISELRLAQMTSRLRLARAEEATGVRELAEIAAATQQALDRRDNLARVAYEGGGSDRMALFFDVDSARDLAERAHVVQTVSDTQGGVIDDLQARRARAVVVQNDLAQDRRDIAALTLQSQAHVAEARQARAEIVTATARLSALVSRRHTQQQAVIAARSAEQRRLASLQTESERLTRLLAARAKKTAAARAAAARDAAGSPRPGATSVTGSRSSSPTSAGAPLIAPVAAPITSSFGMRFHPILGYARLHAGVDFGAPCARPVYAAASGQVVTVGPAGGYGNQIVIDHNGSLATSYSHLQSIAVSSGRVVRGQYIGQVGTTGLSTGCHLHFEVRRDGNPVDPAQFL